MRVDRVVVDTNVLISAALRPHGSLLFSDETFEELRTRIHRPKFDRYVSREDRAVYVAQLDAAAEWVSIVGAKLGCRDPEDDKLLETALMGNASCIVTGDEDLLSMSPFQDIPLMKPADVPTADMRHAP